MSQEKNQTIYDVKVGDYVCVKKEILELQESGRCSQKVYLSEDKKYKILGVNIKDSIFDSTIKIKDDLEKEVIYGLHGFDLIKDEDEKIIKKEIKKTGIENKTGLESKPHLCCFDPHLEYEMGMGMRAGANKHGWNNHRNLTSDSAQQILDSLKRHLNAFLRGEEKDAETNTSHLACVGNNLNFLYRMTKQDGYGKVLENIYGEKK